MRRIVIGFLIAALGVVGVVYLAEAGKPPAKGPDLVVSAQTFGDDTRVYSYEWHDDPAYSGDYCDIQEGLISSPGVHKVLTFTAGATNIGNADLFIGNPAHNALFEFQPCHGHYHFDAYARYTLLDLSGVEVGASNKIGFCINDTWPPDGWDPSNPKTAQRFTSCDRQGLSVGWSDNYVSTVHGQWIEVDDVPPGDYTVRVEMNWAHLLPETNYTNNTATFPVTIP